MRIDKRAQVRASYLLLAVKKEGHFAREETETLAQHLDCEDVSEVLALVVGAATAEDPPVADRRRKRWRRPCGRVTGRLDVVMPVHKHAWPRVAFAAGDNRRPPRRGEYLGPQPRVFEQSCSRLRALGYSFAGGADRRLSQIHNQAVNEFVATTINLRGDVRKEVH